MSTAPVVELHFNPTGLRPSDLTTGPFLGSPADAIEAALAVARAAMVDQMRKEVRGLAEPTHAQLIRIADLAWQLVAWKFRKVSAPIMADAYIHAYRAAEAGDVPMSMIYDLAEKHAEKVGDYFHTSSRDALLEGFNLSVNRRIPAKAAADRVLDAYGLTPRGMRTYVGARQFQTPVTDVMPRSIKAKARAYIDKAFTGRVRKLAKQEEHNIDQQAQQFAWMWLQSKGRLNEHAQKLWITAKDEKVCPVCGPLHNKRVGINERFVTAQGEFWTPGLHPNCRCVIRLLEHAFTKNLAGTALAEFNEDHPRASDGRFGLKRTLERPDYDVATRTHDPQLERMFADLLAGSYLERPMAAGKAPPRPVIDMRRPAPAPVEAPAVERVIRPVAAPKARVQAVSTRPVAASTKPKAATKTEVRAHVKARHEAKPVTKPNVIARTAAKVRAVTKPATKPQPKIDTKTVTTTRTDPTKKTDTRLYAVITNEMMDTKSKQGSRINLTRPEPLMSRAEATALASDMIQQDIDNVVDQVHSLHNNTFKSLSGREYKLSDKQVQNVVEFMARNSAVSNAPVQSRVVEMALADPVVVPELDIYGRPLLDEGGDRVYGSFSPDFVARQFDVNTGLFNAQVAAIDPEHVKWEQGAMADEPGQMSGSRRPYVSGTFQAMKGDHSIDTTHDVSVEVLGIKPYKPIGRPKRNPD